ncbi:hypothetical protein ACFVDU_21475 [Streptomyces albidoflavus]
MLGGTRGIENTAVQLAARIHDALDAAGSSGRRRHEAFLARPPRPVVRLTGPHAARQRTGQTGERKESLRSLALAEKAYDKAGTPSAPGWISFYHRAEFDALSSYVWTALGEHERAESCLHRTLAVLPDGAVRDRGLYTAHLSLAQARQGEAELACATARRAHALVPPGSRRTTNTLVRTRQVLTALDTRAPEVMSWIEEARRWN